MGTVRVGISGWSYAGWRGDFYPRGLAHRRELEHATSLLSTVELNASFYRLQKPTSYTAWYAQTPPGTLFAVKGSRYITHVRKLADVDAALANFLASGLLALGEKLGPLLWQLPPTLPFDAERLDAFLSLLPRTSGQAALLAQQHDPRFEGRVWTTTDVDRPLRHAVEARHPSYATSEYVELLRRQGVANVVSDLAGRYPMLEDVSSDLVYVRLHGAEELYTSAYEGPLLERWAEKIRAWADGRDAPGAALSGPPAPALPGGRDVVVYFDNDAAGHAPWDALALAQRLGLPAPVPGVGVPVRPERATVDGAGSG
ncbi:MAG TPA: DUF72 domain-containing protein [Motilibacteraceae bacterium]|nr:DUF72 domain-containing protein [Motilibacteraceae bacterium]